MHHGEDTIGYGNYAPVTGRVVYAGYLGGLGYAVGIREALRPWVIWWVGHMWSISVYLGEEVSEGRTFLGPIGSTGDSTGVHAHTERREDGPSSYNGGASSDPREFYGGAAGGGATPFPTPSTPARKKNRSMLHFYIDDPSAQRGVRYFVVMPNGAMFDYTSGGSDFPNAVAANIGNAIKTDRALLNHIQGQLRESQPPMSVQATLPDDLKVSLPEDLSIDSSDPVVQDLLRKLLAHLGGTA